MHSVQPTRRQFLRAGAVAAGAAAMGRTLAGAPAPQTREVASDEDPRDTSDESFRLRYIVASCMYGKLPLGEILPEVRRTGARTIDIWPEPHGNQREQIEAMGHERFEELLAKHGVRLHMYSCYNPGLLESVPWMRTAKKLGAELVVANSGGPSGLRGDGLKRAVAKLARSLEPIIDTAASLGVRVAVENHSGSFVNSPESQLRLLDAVDAEPLGIALAPYHLEQDAGALARLVERLGDRLFHFYAWQHGLGSNIRKPAISAMQQLPGYGPLDFAPILKALRAIDYKGFTSIFMHPTPRGIPILPEADDVTLAINLAREYLDETLSRA